MVQSVVDVVVIGGGLGGLCAAKLLTEYGLDVLVLEARDRVGGRTHTLEDPSFKYIDLGGSFVNPNDHRILRVAEELGIQTHELSFEGKTLNHLNARIRQHLGPFTTWNPIAMVDFWNVTYALDKMCDAIPLDQPWKAPAALEWDHTTAEEFFNQICWTNYSKARIVQNIHHGLAVELWEISLLHYLWYRKAGSGVLKHVTTGEVEQESQFVGGAQTISNKLKERLGDKVIGSKDILANSIRGNVIHRSHNGGMYVEAW